MDAKSACGAEIPEFILASVSSAAMSDAATGHPIIRSFWKWCYVDEVIWQ